MYAIDDYSSYISLPYLNQIMTLPSFYVVIVLFLYGIGFSTVPKQLVDPKKIIPPLLLITFNNYFLIPSFTALFCYLLDLPPHITLALLLISLCQGGRFTFLVAWILRGNFHLIFWQVLVSRALSIILLPMIYLFLTYLNPSTRAFALHLEVEAIPLLLDTLFLFIAPYLLGVAASHFFPHITSILAKPFNLISLIFISVYCIFDYQVNAENVKSFWHDALYLVILHNICVFLISYHMAKLFKFNRADSIAICVSSSQINFILILTLLAIYYPLYSLMLLTVLVWNWSSLIISLIIIVAHILREISATFYQKLTLFSRH